MPDLLDAFGPPVALVGAGPGDPGLITRRGAELLAQADLVLYDRLVSPEILELARPAVNLVCVDQLPGCHPDRIGAIGRAMVEGASKGLKVVRLKGGDPILFGRCLEEVEPLIEGGIPYQIVPGVTAALGAAAYAGIPVTDRRLASAVALVTGHENPAKSEGNLDWDGLARFPGTLVFYMAMARLENLANRLLACGKSPETPACIVAQATLPFQKVLVTNLGCLVAEARSRNLQAPAVCLVGPVVNCQSTMGWFEKRPLAGKRILCCRPQQQDSMPLVNALRAQGASVRNIPTMEIQPEKKGDLPGFYPGTPRFWDWVVFSSQPGVHAFFSKLRELGLDSRTLGETKIAVVGNQTAQALERFGIVADLVGAGGNSKALAEELLGQVVGKKVLLVRTEGGREELGMILAPVAQVSQWLGYHQVERPELSLTEKAWLEEAPLDAVVLTSGNIAKGLARLLPPERLEEIRNHRSAVFSLSPVTSESIRQIGWRVHAEASRPDLKAMVEAVLNWGAKRE